MRYNYDLAAWVPQKPEPQPRPAPVPVAPNPQQKGFDDCAKAVWRSQRGYVYLGGQLLVIQSEGVPKWVHADPVTKSQRLTDYNLTLVAAVDLDPWGGETDKSWGQGKQPHKYTSYERDGNGNDQAMHRQYHSYWQRFDQPDPYDGSYDMRDPQSLNRYSYVQNDPVNFVDPTGLLRIQECTRNWWTDANGNRQYSSWTCVTIYDDGGGGGGGAGTGNQQKSNVRQNFRDFLQTMSQDCKDALNGLPGNVLGKLSGLANTAKFYDVNNLQNARASTYVGARAGRQTLGQYFDGRGHMALAVTGGRHPGIYTRGGESTFGGGEGGMYFLLHEMTHLAFPRGKNLDESLGTRLGLSTRGTENWSQAISRFFNNKCNPAEKGR